MSSWPKPQAWNIGAAITTVRSACHGIRSSIATSVPTSPPPGRRAPFGVPVVPEVSSTIRPWRAGRAGALAEVAAHQVVDARLVGPAPTAEAFVGPGPDPHGRHRPARRPRRRRRRTRRRRSAGRRPRAATTSASWGPAKEVLSSSVSAPSSDAATSDSTKPRWLRHRIAMVPMGAADGRSRPARPTASAWQRASSSDQVRLPRSSIRAVPCGRRRAASEMPVVALTPLATTAPIRRNLSGRSGATMPERARVRSFQSGPLGERVVMDGLTDR